MKVKRCLPEKIFTFEKMQIANYKYIRVIPKQNQTSKSQSVCHRNRVLFLFFIEYMIFINVHISCEMFPCSQHDNSLQGKERRKECGCHPDGTNKKMRKV
jgi:hypothetical protein